MAKNKDKKEWGKYHGMGKGGASTVWCMGLIGALVYYWSDITSFATFWIVLFKAVFWPAYLVYDLLKFLNA